MPTIHFLNVKQGDCSVIQHNSGHTTVIDVCNAKREDPAERALVEKASKGLLGSFNQKKYPVNPITYLKEHGILSVFRFILSHPDMDHLDGLKLFFETFSPANFWDTDNKAHKGDFGVGCPFDEEDWKFYKRLRDGKPTSDPKRLTLFSGSKAKYFNLGEDGEGGGDGLHVLAPTPALVKEANETEDYNDCSYVVLYRTGNHKIVFGGDSHDKAWEHVLRRHRASVTNVDLLIAPHHGRDSGRAYEFLDVLRPKMTFFGCANCEHMAYEKWSRRGLAYVTNNQAGSMVVDAGPGPMKLYVTHKPYAEKVNPRTAYSDKFKAYFVQELS